MFFLSGPGLLLFSEFVLVRGSEFLRGYIYQRAECLVSLDKFCEGRSALQSEITLRDVEKRFVFSVVDEKNAK